MIYECQLRRKVKLIFRRRSWPPKGLDDILFVRAHAGKFAGEHEQDDAVVLVRPADDLGAGAMKSLSLFSPHQSRARHGRTLKMISGREPAMVWHADTRCGRYGTGGDPGGFLTRLSALWGDRSAQPIMVAVRYMRERRRCSVCAMDFKSCASLACCPCADAQRGAQFICKDVYLRSNVRTPRSHAATMRDRYPRAVAHGEGNYIADAETIGGFEGEGRVLYRYVSPEGKVDERWNVNVRPIPSLAS